MSQAHEAATLGILSTGFAQPIAGQQHRTHNHCQRFIGQCRRFDPVVSQIYARLRKAAGGGCLSAALLFYEPFDTTILLLGIQAAILRILVSIFRIYSIFLHQRIILSAAICTSSSRIQLQYFILNDNIAIYYRLCCNASAIWHHLITYDCFDL